MRPFKNTLVNNTIFSRGDCTLGFNKEGKLSIMGTRKFTYFLGTVENKQYYWQRAEQPRRRAKLFL